MKRAFLLIVMVMMVSLAMAVNIGECEKIEDLEAREIVRQADTFEFYPQKVGDRITFKNIEYTVISDMTLKVTKVETSAIGTDGVLNIPEKVEEGFNVVRKTLVVFRKEMAVTVMGSRVMYNRTDVKEVKMPSIKVVEEWAFYNCNGLKNVEMPVAETVEGSAFYQCVGLTSVEMPVAETVGEWAFYSCNGLKNVEMPVVKKVASKAFYECVGLTSVSVYVVKTVEDYAFANCKALTSVIMPVVETVADYAFYNCNNLTNVEMPKTGCCFKTSSFNGCPWKPGNNGVASSCP